jgi:glucose-specific phosphotransferase system IIA component
MLGDGLAIDPATGVAVAPLAGKIVVFHSAGHAFAIQESTGLNVLVHLGLDTVQLKGKGFTRLVEVGDEVTAGQEIAHFDLDIIVQAGFSPLVPVIMIDLPAGYRVVPSTSTVVQAGRDSLFSVIWGES